MTGKVIHFQHLDKPPNHILACVDHVGGKQHAMNNMWFSLLCFCRMEKRKKKQVSNLISKKTKEIYKEMETVDRPAQQRWRHPHPFLYYFILSGSISLSTLKFFATSKEKNASKQICQRKARTRANIVVIA